MYSNVINVTFECVGKTCYSNELYNFWYSLQKVKFSGDGSIWTAWKAVELCDNWIRHNSPNLVSLLHLKLGFLNKSISENVVWSYSASADWLLIWHCALIPLHSLGDMSRVTKTEIYLFIYLFKSKSEDWNFGCRCSIGFLPVYHKDNGKITESPFRSHDTSNIPFKFFPSLHVFTIDYNTLLPTGILISNENG